MNPGEFEKRKAEFVRWEKGLGAQQRLVFRLALALTVVMVLYPPKQAIVPSIFGTVTRSSVGYSFIWENPASQLGIFADAVHVKIDGLRLIFQIVIVVIVALLPIRYLKERSAA